jgi:hypothetical protein
MKGHFGTSEDANRVIQACRDISVFQADKMQPFLKYLAPRVALFVLSSKCERQTENGDPMKRLILMVAFTFLASSPALADEAAPQLPGFTQ